MSQVKPSVVFRKPKKKTHSVYELVWHIFVWRDLLVKRLGGDATSQVKLDSEDDWRKVPASQRKKAWKSLLDQLDKNQEDLLKALSGLTDESLDETLAGTKYSLRFCLKGHLEHDIYHSAQIALAAKSF